jgi:hypothetical protein
MQNRGCRIADIRFCSAAVPAAVIGASRPHCEGRMPSRQPARCRRYSPTSTTSHTRNNLLRCCYSYDQLAFARTVQFDQYDALPGAEQNFAVLKWQRD